MRKFLRKFFGGIIWLGMVVALAGSVTGCSESSDAWNAGYSYAVDQKQAGHNPPCTDESMQRYASPSDVGYVGNKNERDFTGGCLKGAEETPYPWEQP